MITCIVEEELRPNPNIYLLDERTESYVPSMISDTRFGRYQFIHHGDTENHEGAFAHIGRCILQEVHEAALWIQAWKIDPQGTRRYYLRQLETRKHTEGWHIHRERDITIASMHVAAFPSSHLWPIDYTWTEGGICAVIGHARLEDTHELQLAAGAIHSMAATSQFVPGTAFLDWLFLNHASVVYECTDTSDNPVMVLLGVHRISVHLWLHQGIIHAIDLPDF